MYFLADQQNTRWEIDMLVHDRRWRSPADAAASGNSLARREQGRVCRQRSQRQNIPWVRAVDPKTGAAKVYTTQPQTPTATPTGEIRTMDCVDCHNRPSHILQTPNRSVDLALADGRIDASLPFIKQQGVAALSATYANREQAMQGIENTLLGYYQKTYPQVYSEKQQAIKAAIAHLQSTYDHYFFPSMKVRWDTYSTERRSF